jgi:hypothetical protein
MRSAVIPAIAVCTAAVVVTASPAHADDASYLADLQSAGVPTAMIGGVFRPDAPVDMGHHICDALCAGETPQDAATKFGWMSQWGPAIVVAAQHDLCPGPKFAAVCGWPQFPVLMRTTLDHLSTAAAPGRCTCSWAAIAVCTTVDRRGARPRPSGTRRRRWSTGAGRSRPTTTSVGRPVRSGLSGSASP